MNTTIIFSLLFLLIIFIGVIIAALVIRSKSYDGVLVITKGLEKDNYLFDVRTPFEEMEKKEHIKLKIVIKTDSI